MKKRQYIAPIAEFIALNVEAPLLGNSTISMQSEENVDECDKSSGLDWDDLNSDAW